MQQTQKLAASHSSEYRRRRHHTLFNVTWILPHRCIYKRIVDCCWAFSRRKVTLAGCALSVCATSTIEHANWCVVCTVYIVHSTSNWQLSYTQWFVTKPTYPYRIRHTSSTTYALQTTYTTFVYKVESCAMRLSIFLGSRNEISVVIYHLKFIYLKKKTNDCVFAHVCKGPQLIRNSHGIQTIRSMRWQFVFV